MIQIMNFTRNNINDHHAILIKIGIVKTPKVETHLSPLDLGIEGLGLFCDQNL